MVADADGTGARKVVSSPGNDRWMPTWSADGQRLMYSADGTENEGEVARVDVDTGEVTVLTENDRHDVIRWRHEKSAPAARGSGWESGSGVSLTAERRRPIRQS